MKYVSFKRQSNIEGPGLSLSCAQGLVAALQSWGWGGSGGAGACGGWSVVPLGAGKTGGSAPVVWGVGQALVLHGLLG